MYSSKKPLRVSFNAPVTLAFAALCVLARGIDMLTGGAANRLVFSVYGSPLSDPLTFVRCVCHVLGHAGWDHLISNMMYILLLGPMIEEKYGPNNTALIILATAVVTGALNMLLFPRTMLLGASGVVFAFILISSVTVREDRTIPVTFILVALLYLGREVYDGITQRDNISQMTHIAGGAVGSVLGFLLSKKKKKDSFF
ncbi:MAG: rhomboid family intramembrane serine protease [Clostridiales bacterium]|nr:rhomboid family intramembrane serine protease [Clostridiales bacterium]